MKLSINNSLKMNITVKKYFPRGIEILIRVMYNKEKESRSVRRGGIIMFGKKAVYEFGVEGMSCGHCKASVEKALLAVDGVKSAQADLEKKSVKVKGDATLKLEALKEAVRAAGYEAK